ncbi:hypothetical protein WR25_10535 [Diploscapter pachys]|uniref:G-protein coupled receptors family 1 profile domain-containing protein n=1 Tax=Diploscapter pachys TaxID=2018661 RepID=A0A2A2LUQ3_9BILA|nr:hypothetical protein WR25_10535 [Diploscapter pachys]
MAERANNTTSSSSSYLNIADYLDEECAYQPQVFLEFKMVFVGIIGMTIAIVSIVNNCLLCYTFNSSKGLRKRNLMYLMWISMFDIFISICYILIMCVQVYTDYFESVLFMTLWHSYLRVAFTVSHIAISCSSFLLMAATIERYLQSTGDMRDIQLFRILATHRTLVVVICFVCSALFRGTIFFEVEVIHNEACTGLSSLSLIPKQIFENELMDNIWKVYTRKLMTVFLPFIVLAYFNAAIVMNVRRTDRDQTVKALVLFITVGTRGEVTRLRSRLRAVTRMLILVVTCYLAANFLDVVVAFWETFDQEYLWSHKKLYTVLTDLCSFLPLLACAMRLPIYAITDRQIRMEVSRKLHSMCMQFVCLCCPTSFSSTFRLRKKLYEPEIETEKFITYSTKSSTLLEPRLDARNYGVGSLIMARASISTKNDFQDLARFSGTTAIAV